MPDSDSTPHILLITKDSLGNSCISSDFENAGWGCTTVSDLDLALEKSKSSCFDLILTDYSIPNISGPEIIRRLKGCNPQQAIIVVTASATVEEAVELIKAGALDLISAPIDFGKLVQRLARSLSLVRKEGWNRRLFNFILDQYTHYEFKTKDLVNEPIPIMIVSQLFEAGIITEYEHLRLSLVLQEAFANAIEHGNLELKSEWRDRFDDQGIDEYCLKKKERLLDRKYSDRLLRIETIFKDMELKIIIKDSGPGFDYKKIVVTELPSSDPMKLSGRGNLMINQGVDSFEYSDGGRTLTLVKQLGKLPYVRSE